VTWRSTVRALICCWRQMQRASSCSAEHTCRVAARGAPRRTQDAAGRAAHIDGTIIAGQKVRGFHPGRSTWSRRAAATSPSTWSRWASSGLVFPRRDGLPWRSHDWKNWTRRVWQWARAAAGIQSLPPYDLRHAFASLQIRAGVSVPDLAEQMGHAAAMTIGTYTHVIRELKGEPIVPAEEQIERAREERAGRWGTPRRRAPVRSRRGMPWFAGMARPGLEPGTPRFSASWGDYLMQEETPANQHIGQLDCRVCSLWIRGVAGGLWTWRSGHVLFARGSLGLSGCSAGIGRAAV
jgi:hypothetical protein